MGGITKINLIIPVVLLILVSCNKKDISKNQNPTQLPKLIKTLDTLVSSQKEDRVFYYYSLNGNCDSIVYQTQYTGPGVPPAWSNNRLRFEYNSDSLPLRAFMRIGSSSEYLYCEIQYSNTGKIKKLINYSDTIKYAYDVNDRLVIDSQFNVFGIWQNSHAYVYDVRNNVAQFIYIYAFTPGIGTEVYTHDSGINPFRNLWNFQPGPISVSTNNITSQGFSINPNPSFITTYVYNNFNLPIKSYLYSFGQPNPIRIKTYFYQ